jgi:hypothetical protein
MFKAHILIKVNPKIFNCWHLIRIFYSTKFKNLVCVIFLRIIIVDEEPMMHSVGNIVVSNENVFGFVRMQ